MPKGKGYPKGKSKKGSSKKKKQVSTKSLTGRITKTGK